MIYVTGQDAVDAPFGAMLHIDWIEIKRNTQAFRAAQRALVCTDDLTSFLGDSPRISKQRRPYSNSFIGSTMFRPKSDGGGATVRLSFVRRHGRYKGRGHWHTSRRSRGAMRRAQRSRIEQSLRGHALC